MLKFISLTTSKLSKNSKEDILKLKDTNWKYGIKSQKRHFLKNIKKNDIHNLIYINKILVGYTLLRNSKLKIKNKKIDYLHFDTIIVRKKFRNQKFSNLLMFLNNFVIEKNNKKAILYCEKNMINFYKKYNWRRMNAKINFIIKNEHKKIIMKYNFD
tara:strand:- start:1070 stop:1540 length:471 start_codon:yes stop_codon:yes gene_type:complete